MIENKIKLSQNRSKLSKGTLIYDGTVIIDRLSIEKRLLQSIKSIIFAADAIKCWFLREHYHPLAKYLQPAFDVYSELPCKITNVKYSYLTQQNFQSRLIFNNFIVFLVFLRTFSVGLRTSIGPTIRNGVLVLSLSSFLIVPEMIKNVMNKV